VSRKLLLIGALLAACRLSLGIIDVRFPPKVLVEESEIIAAGSILHDKDANQWHLKLTEAIKGKAKEGLPGPRLLDLTKCNPDHVKAITDAFAGKEPNPVILFVGPQAQPRTVYLHVAGTWLGAKESGKDRWEIGGITNQMNGTFCGGTDMLVRMSKYLVRDPNGDSPVSAGVRWADHCTVAKVDPQWVELATRPTTTLAAIEYPRTGAIALFAASTAGDRLFVAKPKEAGFDDFTARAKVGSASAKFTFVDINSDGLADLISFNGKEINVYIAAEKGTFIFSPRPGSPNNRSQSGEKMNVPFSAGWSFPVEDCIDLAPCSTDGKPGILISTQGDPILLAGGQEGWKKIALPAFDGDVGRRSPCIVADLDNDGFVDILQPGESDGVWWKGRAGGFEKPVKSPVCAGPGAAKAAVADYNEDGFLDIFLAGSEKNSLWENDGKGGFAEVLRYSGSMSYKCPPGASDAKAMDLNHDGRMDLCLTYSAGNLLYHFNRGFRSFGEEGEVRLPGVNAGPGNERTGQMALAVGDFNGDSSTDLAILLTDGAIQVYFNHEADMPAVMLRLPKGVAGPVTAAVVGRVGNSPYAKDQQYAVATGVAAVVGHTPGSLLPLRRAGKVIVKYRFPGREPVAKKVEVGDRTVDVLLTPDGN